MPTYSTQPKDTATRSNVSERKKKRETRVVPERTPVQVLQRTLGNQGTREFVQGETLQPKLETGNPDDKFEREAERVADHVMKTNPSPAVASISETGQSGPLVQRQAICTPEDVPGASTRSDVVLDYENQVCRPATPEEMSASVPESAPVDGEFWVVPPSIDRPNVKPIYDEDSNAVVGFRYYSSGYWEIYDLEGNLVEVGEKGLEKPLIDPIDIIAGGLVGLGRGLFGGGIRGLGRGAAGGAGRGAAASAGRTGLLVSIKALSKRAATALRGAYRAVRFRGPLNFTATTAARMADPARRVPKQILQLALRFGKKTPDPQGVSGASRYAIQMFRNGKEYTLEVVIREADNTVLHFLYK